MLVKDPISHLKHKQRKVHTLHHSCYNESFHLCFFARHNQCYLVLLSTLDLGQVSFASLIALTVSMPGSQELLSRSVLAQV